MDTNEVNGQRKLDPIDTSKEVAEAAEAAVDEKSAGPVEPRQQKLAGSNAPANEVAEEAANDAELSSPPDSSSVSSVNPDMLGDEIVVGTRANGDNNSNRRVASEKEDIDMVDAADNEPVAHYPKRKRASLYNDLSEDKMDGPMRDGGNVGATVVKTKAQQKLEEPTKHVPVGYWRDSPVPQDEGKHSVVGFMDVRDRLRTRIAGVTINGELVNSRLFPVPPGPGGSWVTFERIVFLDHLVGHDHNVIKEYVKVRLETIEVRSEEADHAAIREAQRRLEINPPPETPQLPIIAWGREIPVHAQGARHESKRRRVGSGYGTPASTLTDHVNRAQHERDEREQAKQAKKAERAEQADAEPVEHPGRPIVPQQPHELLPPPRKPTRILVGCWTKSSPSMNEDKHAVYGILGANDMFRVKLVRETMDGRYINGNFPSGAGALWIPYDEVTFVNHLKDLTRPEIKEYVRIRQSQIDAGETSDEQVANETKAVYEAQARAAMIASTAVPNRTPVQGNAGSGPASSIGREDVRDTHELRLPRRDAPSLSEPRREQSQPPRYSLPEAEIRQASRPPSNDPIERVQGFANREVAKMEAVQLRSGRYQANRSTAASPGNGTNPQDNRRDFDENVVRMNQVWLAQQESIRRAPENGTGNVMTHKGVKYERKQNGPFKDRLVSQGTIINIDGEDYVEYRVLMKPSFF
ncbi:hypothetical protein F4677DRAFT_270309 [Hypoxylon crocopeplum]|nr:hypothetical protein F4677DRAFT_270309 [Hypoxylon crocopeplum]